MKARKVSSSLVVLAVCCLSLAVRAQCPDNDEACVLPDNEYLYTQGNEMYVIHVNDWLANPGDPYWLYEVAVPGTAGMGITDIQVVDYDADGDLELTFLQTTGAGWLPQVKVGHYSPGGNLDNMHGNAAGGLTCYTVGDYDNDGAEEFIYRQGGPLYAISIDAVIATGDPYWFHEVEIPGTAGMGITDIQVVDYDADGDLELTFLQTTGAGWIPQIKVGHYSPGGALDNMHGTPVGGLVSYTIGDYNNDAILDCDCDGLTDAEDNCPQDPNPGQEDCDGDGIGDACDETPCPTAEIYAEACNRFALVPPASVLGMRNEIKTTVEDLLTGTCSAAAIDACVAEALTLPGL